MGLRGGRELRSGLGGRWKRGRRGGNGGRTAVAIHKTLPVLRLAGWTHGHTQMELANDREALLPR